MSGHSKWHSIRHKKGKEDAKRGKIFTKLIRELTVSARSGGGDPSMNPRLRAAIVHAKAENMPADNIDRAIKKGTGELEGVRYEECSFEGHGPGGTAILIEAMTDNKNRCTAEIRHIFTRHNGSLGTPGSVSWQFTKKGYFAFPNDKVSEDDLMETALEAGAEDVVENPDEQTFEVLTPPESFLGVKDVFEKKGLAYQTAEVTMIPKNTVRLQGKEAEQVLRLVDLLEDNDDVQNVYANFDISREEMERLNA
ncbi:MAG: YebC/PmpR family DNA-binding transcriptional regulator [bacterium]